MQVIQFYAEFAKLTGSIPAAVFLTHALRFQRRCGGWFCKTIAEWEKATTLSREQQELARQKLSALGLLREVRKGLPPKLWYWVDEDHLNQMINGLKEENPQINLRKKRKQICGKSTDKSAENPQIKSKQICGKTADVTTTVVDTTLFNVIDYTNNVIRGNRDYVDNVVESFSFLQDSFYKEDLCLLNTHAEQNSACVSVNDRIFFEDNGKERKQTDLLLTSENSSAHDKDGDASGTSSPAHHALTGCSTTAENEGAALKMRRADGSGVDAETEGAVALNSENAQKSFIGDFLVQDIPNIVPEQENASGSLKTALKRKSSRAGKVEKGDAAKIVSESDGRSEKSEVPRKRQKTETPEERKFREEFYDFAKKAVDWIVSRGGLREDPAQFWRWAKRLKHRDTRITPDTLKQCFRHYVASTDGTWWRSNTKTLKQFVSAFDDIYQSYQHCLHVQTNQPNQLNQKGDNHAIYSANHELYKRAKYWQQWLQTAYQSGFTKT